MAQYPFGADFEKRLFALVLRDTEFLKRRGNVVKSEYFTHQYCKLAMTLVDKHYSEYRQAPDEMTFRELVRQEFAKHPPSKEVKSTWDSFLQELWTLTARDAKFIINQAVKWAQEQAWRKLVEDGARRIDEGRRTGYADFENFPALVEETRQVGVERPDAMSNYFESTNQRLAKYHFVGQNKIPCGVGFRNLETSLNGGLERGELGVIAAPTSRGKTAALVQIGCVGGIMSGQRILAVSLELSSFNFQKRVDKCIALQKEAEIRDDPGALLERLEWLKKFNPDLRVLEYPALTCSIEDIEAQLEIYRDLEGWIPSMLVLDYASLVKPPTKREDFRHEVEGVILTLRALARSKNMAVWTAAQTNRGSFTKNIITTADIGESIGISQHCDVMLTICQSNSEALENKCRFFVAKNREGEARKVIEATYDKYVNRFEETGDVKDANIVENGENGNGGNGNGKNGNGNGEKK